MAPTLDLYFKFSKNSGKHDIFTDFGTFTGNTIFLPILAILRENTFFFTYFGYFNTLFTKKKRFVRTTYLIFLGSNPNQTIFFVWPYYYKKPFLYF